MGEPSNPYHSWSNKNAGVVSESETKELKFSMQEKSIEEEEEDIPDVAKDQPSKHRKSISS